MSLEPVSPLPGERALLEGTPNRVLEAFQRRRPWRQGLRWGRRIAAGAAVAVAVAVAVLALWTAPPEQPAQTNVVATVSEDGVTDAEAERWLSGDDVDEPESDEAEVTAVLWRDLDLYPTEE